MLAGAISVFLLSNTQMGSPMAIPTAAPVPCLNSSVARICMAAGAVSRQRGRLQVAKDPPSHLDEGAWRHSSRERSRHLSLSTAPPAFAASQCSLAPVDAGAVAGPARRGAQSPRHCHCRRQVLPLQCSFNGCPTPSSTRVLPFIRCNSLHCSQCCYLLWYRNG